MTFIYFINYLNHHQVAITDQLYDQLGDDFVCFCTSPRCIYEMKGGEDFSSRPYCLNVTENIENYNLALRMAREADVCVFGANSSTFAIERAKNNKDGLSLELGERWFKKGYINMLSPNFIRWFYNYHKYYKKANFYRLCASAYAPGDLNFVRAYMGRCIRWGYFIRENSPLYNRERENSKEIKIMWCGRFLKWKHPELAIKLAYRLKAKGYDFIINMFGCGERMDSVKKMASDLNICDRITFYGSLPNERVISEMGKHDIFLATSDFNEGWGVVVNEAMLSGCAVVASKSMGSVPYLINDGYNGFTYESNSLNQIEEIVTRLLDNPSLIQKTGINAINTISSLWSSQNAVHQLLVLIHKLKNNECYNHCNDGPGSLV